MAADDLAEAREMLADPDMKEFALRKSPASKREAASARRGYQVHADPGRTRPTTRNIIR